MQLPDNIWSGDLFIFGVLVLTFAGFTTLMILGIIAYRLLVKWRRYRALKPQKRIKNCLNAIASMAASNDSSEKAEVEQARRYLELITQRSPGLAQFVIDHLLDLYKSLSGISAKALKMVYDDLHLYRVSKQKLMQGNYAEVIQGIQELAEMKRHQNIESVIGFLDHYHPLVRLETRVALVRLVPEDPLHALKFMRDRLTRWEEILIYNKLKSLAPEQIPPFKTYFSHPDPRVVCYSINMAARFLQYDAIEQITGLIFHKNTDISWQAVNALKLLEADQAAKYILLLLHKTKSLKVRVECIECLAQIGDTQKLAPLFKKVIDQTNNPVVTKTLTKVFVNWHKSGANKLTKVRVSGKNRLLYSHFSNPLIN